MQQTLRNDSGNDGRAGGRESQSRPMPVQSIILIALFALAAMLSLRGNRPPAALGLDAPAAVFSAARAHEVLARILGDGRPHPTGSAANAAVRDRVVAEFDRLGLDAEVQRRFVCGAVACATVDNIVARLPGANGAQAAGKNAVLLSAHYDSVAAGPGASDDGAGVATLIEVARALQAGPALPRDVWLLANDGEELGLLGAEAFVREPEFANVGSVVNLEARGTTGASLLIETQPGNAAIIEAVDRALDRPGGTSLDYEIYKTLPNDTDFTVYRREGRSGVNFAWAQGAARYHTPLDDLAHLDPGSLQHHGDNMLAMVRELATAPAQLQRPHDAVFFSLFGRELVSWPAPWNPTLLLLGLAASTLLVVRLVRSGQSRLLPLLGAGFAAIAALVLLALLSWAMHALLGALGATPAAWTAQATNLVATLVLLAMTVFAGLARPMSRWFGAPALAAAALMPFALVAIGAVLAMPGASHSGLLPLIAGALAGHLWPRRPALWAGIAAIAAAMLWFPYVADSYSAVGHPGLPAASVLMGLILLPLLPALADLGRGASALAGAALVGTVLFAVLAVMRPAFDADAPRPLNLVYAGVGDDARVFANTSGPLPEEFLRDAGFAATTESMLPWSPRTRHPGRGGPPLAPPVIEVLDDTVRDGRRHLQLRLRSSRGATEGELILPESVDLASVRIQGEALATSRHPRSGPWRSITVVGLPAAGVLVEFEADPAGAIALYGVDVSPGIPEPLADVVRARDAIAVPIHGGDITVSWTRLELAPAE
ncbi:MAG: M20/M25/M40 family metallo-hydrolase [Lysobacter sp.]